LVLSAERKHEAAVVVVVAALGEPLVAPAADVETAGVVAL
jgi:hypothetical protein